MKNAAPAATSGWRSSLRCSPSFSSGCLNSRCVERQSSNQPILSRCDGNVLSILCIILSAKITASAIIECMAGRWDWCSPPDGISQRQGRSSDQQNAIPADIPYLVAQNLGQAAQAAKSILVMEGGSYFSSSFPSLLILASSSFSAAPTSMAKPVQYNQVIKAMAAPSVP